MNSKAEKLECLVPDSFELKGSGKGALSKLTFVVKDLIALEGHTSSFGHAKWRETHKPALKTAPVVTRLLESGASMVGVAKMDQLAYSIVGNVGEGTAPLNSLVPERFTGGSSSGSASAVAGGLADIGVGTDTGGSIRVPASACGLFGIRPTHGVINSTGVLPLAQSFDVVGLLARNATVLSDAFKALKPALAKPAPALKEVLLATDVLEGLEPELASTIRASAHAIAATTGGTVKEVSFARFVSPDVGDLFARLQSREIWANHGQWVEQYGQHLAPDVQTRLARCKQFSASPEAEKKADEKARERYAKEFTELIGTNRALVMPVTPVPVPLRNSTPAEQLEFRTRTFRLVAPSSSTGNPQLTIPARAKSGSVKGVGLLGPRGSDNRLLEIALKATKGKTKLSV